MKFDDIRKLQQKKYRQEFGCFLVEGEHLVHELQKAARHTPALLQSTLLVSPAYQHWISPFKTEILSERRFAQLADTETPQGILAVVPFFEVPEAFLAPGRTERALYLHEVQDPGNLGSILRTLAWFGGYRLLLSPGCVDPFNPKVVRASMGGIFHVPIERDVTAERVAQRFARVAVLDMAGADIHTSSFAHHDCYCFGNEARGLPGDLPGTLHAASYTIAGAGLIESLNLAATVGIAVHELQR